MKLCFILIASVLLTGCNNLVPSLVKTINQHGDVHIGLGGGKQLTGAHVFIMAGQSNMVGTAMDTPFAPTDPRITMLGNDYVWKQASDPLDDPTGQIDLVSRDEPTYTGVGVGMTFANTMLAQSPQMEVVLVPCAKAASVLWQWYPNPSRSSLYGSMIHRALLAKEKGQLAGFLWWQGESDRDRTADQANQYPQDLINFVRSVRADLNEPNLPVIIVQLHKTPPLDQAGFWDAIKTMQERAVQGLDNAALVKTDDLPVQTLTELHVTGEAYKEVGRRIAKAYIGLVLN